MINYEAKLRDAILNIERVGSKYAQAKGESWLLQEQRKSVLAKKMSETEGKSITEREMLARASVEFTDFIRGVSDGIAREHKLKAELDKHHATFEALRSLMSMEKQLMKEHLT